MIRAADASVVRYALFEVRNDGQVTGGLSASELRLGAGPTDLRLTRRGHELLAQVRQGGGEWKDVGRATLEMPARLSLGVAAVNRAASPLRAAFARFELTPAPGTPSAGSTAGSAAAGGVQLDLDAPPRVRKQVRPEYPRDAYDARIEGTVLVEALVDNKGHVAKARVIQSVPGLDEAALRAARNWQFYPAIKNGKAVATIIHMPVKFLIY